MVNRAKIVRPDAVEAGMLIAEVKLNSVPVKPRLITEHLYVAFENDTAQAPQRLTQDLTLLLELKRVGSVLIMTTATIAEILASRGNSFAGRFDNIERLAAK